MDQSKLSGATWKNALQPVIDEVTKAFGITEESILSRCRTKSIAEARTVCYWVARESGLRLSLYEIGAVFGRCTEQVSRGISLISKRRKTDVWLRDVTLLISKRIRGEAA